MCLFPEWSQGTGTAQCTSRLMASIVEKSSKKAAALNRSDLMGRGVDGSTRDVRKSLDLSGP